MDNAPVHSRNLDTFDEDVRVEFLPPNTTSIFQPMDQGPIRMCQTNYLKLYMLRMNDKMNLTAKKLSIIEREQQEEDDRDSLESEFSSDDSPSEEEGDAPPKRRKTNTKEENEIMKYWTRFNIYTSILLLGQAWNNVTERCIISSWKKLCPYLLENDFEGFDVNQEESRHKVQALKELRSAGINDAKDEDIEEMLNANFQLEFEDLEKIVKEREEDYERDRALAAKSKPDKRELNKVMLEEIMETAEHLKDIILKYDFNADRATRAMNGISQHVSIYKRLLHEKRQAMPQASIMSYFSPKSTPSSTPVKEKEDIEDKVPAALPPLPLSGFDSPAPSEAPFAFISPCSVALTDILQASPQPFSSDDEADAEEDNDKEKEVIDLEMDKEKEVIDLEMEVEKDKDA